MSGGLRYGHGAPEALGAALVRSRSAARTAGVACYACGALPDEKHDPDAHREYAREMR